MKEIETNEVKLKEESYLTFKEMMVEFESRPKINYLWSGIKENSFGLVFGPSKSGKTIFCENLAIRIAVGAKDYLGYKLDGIPKKTLFIGLEEDWKSRAERNKKQFDVLNTEQKDLMNLNYLYQPIEYYKRIVRKQDWESLFNLIQNSNAKVVFIDSITRMNPGQLENSADAEFVMQKLRDICYNLGITLICVHHTPKMYDKPIIMDSIKGSSTFAQESDFAVAINRTSKEFRYLKNVFFRYAPDDDDTVKEFEIDNNLWLNFTQEEEEDSILARTDRRRKDTNRDAIIRFLDENQTATYQQSELVDILKDKLPVKERMIKSYLSELSKDNKINNITYGNYASINYKMNDNNEEERRQ